MQILNLLQVSGSDCIKPEEEEEAQENGGHERRREDPLEEFGEKQESGQCQSRDCVLAYKKRKGMNAAFE